MQHSLDLDLSHSDVVCKLQKSLYGLKRASTQQNTTLNETLITSSYIQSKVDYSLFAKKTSTCFTVSHYVLRG